MENNNMQKIFKQSYLTGILFIALIFPASAIALTCQEDCQQQNLSSTDLQRCIANCSSNNSTSPTGNGTSGTGASNFPNPIGADSLMGVLKALLSNLMGVVAIIAIIFIVIGGIMYMTSAGDEKKITTAKNIVTYAVIGLAIVLAAPTFLKEVITILGGNRGLTSTGAIDSALTIRQIAVNVLNLLLSIVGILAIIALVVGGGLYLTSYGDEDRMKTGKKVATWAIIGIAIAIGSLTIVRQIASFFGVQ
jgi:hypothetical protein